MIPLTLVSILAAVPVVLLAALQWGAARRRELLYFHLTLEKPGSAYFRDARIQREEQSRLAAAVLVLILRNTLVLVGAMAAPDILDCAAGRSAASWMEVIGLTFLSYALLYPALGKRAYLSRLAWGVIALALGALLASTWSLPHPDGSPLAARLLPFSIAAARVFQAGVAGVTLAAVLAGSEKPGWLAWALPLWLVGPFLGLQAHQGAMMCFYLALAVHAYRRTVDDYEALETSHHRLQRQREVIVQFLDRIGGAYSAALDLDQVLRLVAATGIETTGAGAAAIYLLDRRTLDLQMQAMEGYFPPLYREVPATDLRRHWEDLTHLAMQQLFALGEGVVGEVAASARPRRIPDARAAGILAASVCDPVRRHPMLLVPLLLRHEVLGVLAVLNKQTADEFSDDDQFLLSALAEQAAFLIDNARMVAALATQERVQRELQIARDIQHLLLPTDSPDVPGFDIRALGRPALEMGGDYYDFFWAADGFLGIVVADVSGKGVPAALTMAMLRTVMRTQAAGNASVRDVLARANAALSADLRMDTFITLFYGILDVRRRVLSWARAGHEPTILLRGGQAETRAPAGSAIGVLSPDEFADYLAVESLPLAPGDAVVVYSDGITEAMDVTGEEFGLERFLAALCAGERLTSAERICRVEDAVNAWSEGAAQQDDITLVVLTA